MNVPKHMKELENLKRLAIIGEAKDKLLFLGIINDKDDNSSELAGFEINKLLQRQIELEKDYAHLILERSTLKGITNKAKFEQVQEKIAQVSTSLKESTKKLCKLFKENTKINDDVIKVRRERIMLMDSLETLITAIKTENLSGGNGFQHNLISDLEKQNQLAELQEKEKTMNAQLKKIKKDLNDETILYNNEAKDKDLTIQKLKEEIAKAKTFASIESNYESKAYEAKKEIERRLAEQKKQELMKQISDVIGKKKRESEVAERIQAFQKKKQADTLTQAKFWTDKNEAAKEKMDTEILGYESEIREYQELLEKLQKEHDEFMRLKKKEEEDEKQMLKEKEDEKKRLSQEDLSIRIIQKHFESWFNKYR